jgi:hypothetical protein
MTGVTGFALSSAAIGLSGSIAGSLGLVIAFRCVAALVMSLLVLRETKPSPAASSLDIPGIAALSGALFLLIWGLIKGSSYGWGSARTVAFLGGAGLVGLSWCASTGPASRCYHSGCSAQDPCRPAWRWSCC